MRVWLHSDASLGFDHLWEKYEQSLIREMRRLIDIPAAFIGESSMYHACALGRKVSIVARTMEVMPKFEENIRNFGLTQNISEISYLSFTLNQLALAFENPKPVIEEFL